jgi:hypothetical protein
VTSDARRERLQRDLERLEAEFRERLLAALRKCAAGVWGLFGQNDDSCRASFRTTSLKRLESVDARDLTEMETQIEHLRARLGYAGPHPLCERFEAYRAFRGSNVPGEPKLARMFLEELGA